MRHDIYGCAIGICITATTIDGNGNDDDSDSTDDRGNNKPKQENPFHCALQCTLFLYVNGSFHFRLSTFLHTFSILKFV